MSEPRTLLCFGDSNTWGFDPLGGGRYPRGVRWPGAAAAVLGPDWCVVEAGLNGRTTVFEDPMGDLAGVRHLGPVLASAAPVDVVAIVLGTNDLKTRFGASAPEIADGAGVVVDRALASRAGPAGCPPAVLLVAPPPIDAGRALAERDPEAFAERTAAWHDARARSLAFAHHYARVADQRGIAFLDAGAHLRSSDVDMIHWSPAAHAALGSAVAEAVRRLTVQ